MKGERDWGEGRLIQGSLLVVLRLPFTEPVITQGLEVCEANNLTERNLVSMEFHVLIEVFGTQKCPIYKLSDCKHKATH